MRGAWYASGGSWWRDLWTLFHAPYTSMVLAYVTIGSALAPELQLDRYFAILAAYILGLGGAAHFLDEVHGHPWSTGFTNRTLYFLAAVTIVPAVAIGIYYAMVISLFLLLFVVMETFFAFAYNLEWFGGRFHTDFWFSISWGGLPFLTGFFVQAVEVPIWTLPVAAALSASAGVEISLSRWVKAHRRSKPIAGLEFTDGTRSSHTTEALIQRPQRALKLIVLTVDLLAVGLLIRGILLSEIP